MLILELDDYRVEVVGDSLTAQQVADAITEQTRGIYTGFVTDGGALCWRLTHPHGRSSVTIAAPTLIQTWTDRRGAAAESACYCM